MFGTGLWTPDSRVKPAAGSELDWGHPLAQGMLSSWLLYEGSGAKVFDGGGYGNSLGIAQPSKWTPGADGPALHFDGTGSNYASIAGVLTALANLSAYSVEATFRSTAASASDIAIYAEGNGGTNTPIVLLRAFESGTTVQLTHRDNTNVALNVASAASGLNDGAWHHVVATRQGSSWAIYVDGVLSGTATATIGATTVQNQVIGWLIRQSNYGPFNGDIGRVRTWSRALAAGEIAQIHDAPYCMMQAGAVRRFYSIAPAPPPTTTALDMVYVGRRRDRVRARSGIVYVGR